MCSKRWAKPVRPGRSSLEPTWYQTLTPTIGVAWSSCRMTCRPLGSVYFSNFSSGICGMVLAVAARSVTEQRAAARADMAGSLGRGVSYSLRVRAAAFNPGRSLGAVRFLGIVEAASCRFQESGKFLDFERSCAGPVANWPFCRSRLNHHRGLNPLDEKSYWRPVATTCLAFADGSNLTVGDARLRYVCSAGRSCRRRRPSLARGIGGAAVTVPGLAAVPEPSTPALVIAVAAAAAGGLWRRRKHSSIKYRMHRT